MRRTLLVLVLGCVLLAGAIGRPVFGLGTPDGQPPSRETVCDGLSGAAFGLCNAYCEAQDCDVHPRPSCAQLRKNFLKKTGSPIFPCDRKACEFSDAPACNGTCPAGKMCVASSPDAAILHPVTECVCVLVKQCDLSGAPACNGTCPKGQRCKASSDGPTLHPVPKCECVNDDP